MAPPLSEEELPLLAVVVNATTLMISTQNSRNIASSLQLMRGCVIKKAGSLERVTLPPPGKTVIVTAFTVLKKNGDTVVTEVVVPHKYGFRTAACTKGKKCEGQDRVTCAFSHENDTIARGMWSLNDTDYDKLSECLLLKADPLEITKIEEVARVSADGVLEENIGVVLRAPDETRKVGVIRLDGAPQGVSGVYAFLKGAGNVETGARVVFGAVCSLVGADTDLTVRDTLVPVAAVVIPYDALNRRGRSSPASPAKARGNKQQPLPRTPLHHDAAAGAAAQGTDGNSVRFGTRTDSSTAVRVNVHGPFCVVTVGLQGGGKSHTQRVLLESCTMQTPNPYPEETAVRQPMSALVCHFEHHDRGVCEYAFIAEGSGESKPPKVYVFTSPLNYARRRQHYKDAGLGKTVEVVPLKFHWPLATPHLRKLMKMKRDEDHLFMSVVSKVLLKQHRTFAEFRADLELQDYRNETQRIGVRQRLDLVERFMAIGGQTDIKRIEECACEPGTVLLVDMSDPNLNETDANAVFQVVFEQFHETQTPFGKLAVFDEAHKYLNDRDDLSKSIVDAIRQQRKWGFRVAISTQSPEVVQDEILDLVSAVVMHRFHSPAWFKRLRQRVPLDPLDYDKVRGFKPGQCCVYSSGDLFVGIERDTTAEVEVRDVWTRSSGHTKVNCAPL